MPELEGSEVFTRIDCRTRANWLKERQLGLGGSDAAAVLGLNPYKTNERLWEEKTGQVVAEDIGDKPYVKYGTDAEDPLRKLFALDFPNFEVKHFKNQLIRNNKLPFLQASLDGELIDKETGKLGVLEVKTTAILKSLQNEKWDGRVPDNYYCQILHCLLVTGFDFAILKAQLKYEYSDGVKLVTKHYRFNRNDVAEDMRQLLRAEIRFWDCVTKNQRPAVILPAI